MVNSATLIPVSGETYGRLTAVAEAPRRHERDRLRWWFDCDCGTRVSKMAKLVVTLQTRSCGCLAEEQSLGNRTRTHGMTNTHEYSVWRNMINRCHNANVKSYKDYGARGISVCAEWRGSFAAFFADMGITPSGMELDRIDSTGNYSKENCRWVTGLVNGRNRRNVIIVTAFGESMTIGEWSERTGIKHSTIGERIRRGVKPEDALCQG